MPAFAKTARPCPPFCMQPMPLAPGVETLGDSKSLTMPLIMSAGDSSIILADSRTPGKEKEIYKARKNHVGPERAYCIAQI